MNWDQAQGNWKQFSGKIRERWGEFTDDDLEKVKGRREQLEGAIQERYGISREEAHRQLDEVLDRCRGC
ncbi:MAG: CsbD family protein [Planctomycetaceae bacterium]|nr:CsbD family protein [Planctomycetaceae bacterium]